MGALNVRVQRARAPRFARWRSPSTHQPLGDVPNVAARKFRVTRRYMFRAVITAVILATTVMVGCGGQRVETVKDETDLIRLQQTLATAWLNGDRATVENIIAPDWISTGPDGRTTDRARVLAQVFETGAHKIRGLEIDEVNARVFGDAAVVTGRTHGLGEFEGSGYDVIIRFTDTFVRREGRWQAVASHASLVQGPR